MKKIIQLISFCIVIILFSVKANAAYNNNYSASFNGRNAYLTLPQTTGDMELHTPVTIEFWMKPKAYPQSGKYAMLFQKANPANGNGIYISMDDEGIIGATINNDYFTTPAPAVIGFWTHISVCYNNDKIWIYYNGSEVLYQSLVAGDIYQPYETYIGAMKDGAGTMVNFYKGEMDELRIWSTPRAWFDVLNYCHQSYTGVGTAYSNLRISLPLNNSFTDQAGKELNTVQNKNVTFVDHRNENNSYISYNSSLWNNNNTLFAPDHNDLDATTAVTIEFWARIIGGDYVGFYKGNGIGVNYLLRFGYAGSDWNIRFLYTNASGEVKPIVKNIPAEFSPVGLSWNHIAASYEASSGNLKLYFNASVILDTIIVAAENLVPNDQPLIIQNVNGCYDEIRIWKNTVRTADEIKADMFKAYNYTMNPAPQNVTVYDFDGRMDDVMKPFPDSAKTIYLPSGQNVYYKTYDYFSKPFNSGLERSTAPLLRGDDISFGDKTKYTMSTKRLSVDLFKNTTQVITDSLFIKDKGKINDFKMYVFADVERFTYSPSTGINEMVKITLISPSGKEVQLTPDYTSGYLGNNLYTVFDMNAADKIDYNGFDNLPPFCPSVKPYQSFNSLQNKKAKGWWRLKIEVPAVLSFNSVELLGWGIYPITSAPTESEEFANKNSAANEIFSASAKAFPNPFTASFNISYQLKEKSDVQISIINAAGKIVAQVLNKKDDIPGTHQLSYNAASLRRGIYFCSIITGNKKEMIKIVKQ